MKKISLQKRIPWRILFNTLILLLCAGLIFYFCFSDGGLTDLLRSGRSIDFRWLIAGALVYLCHIALDVVLMYRFLKPTVPSITVRQSLKTALAGMFYSAVTPGASGGQPMQVVTLSRYGVEAGKATSALMQRFLVWQFSVTGYSIAVVLLRLTFFADHVSLYWWILAGIGFAGQVGIIVVLLTVSYSPKITGALMRLIHRVGVKLHLLRHPERTMERLEGFARGFHVNNGELMKHKGSLAISYLITIAELTAIFSVPYFVCRALLPPDAIHAGLIDMICIQAVVNVMSSIFPLPGGSGMAEYSFSGFFGSIFDEASLKSAILIWRLITYYGTIAVCAPFSGLVKKRRESREVRENRPESSEELTEDGVTPDRAQNNPPEKDGGEGEKP